MCVSVSVSERGRGAVACCLCSSDVPLALSEQHRRSGVEALRSSSYFSSSSPRDLYLLSSDLHLFSKNKTKHDEHIRLQTNRINAVVSVFKSCVLSRGFGFSFFNCKQNCMWTSDKRKGKGWVLWQI